MIDARTQLDAAKRAVLEAEERLRGQIAERPAARRAEKVEVSEELRAAFDDLRVAQAALAHLEKPAALAQSEPAQKALTEAKAELQRVLSGLEVLPRAEKKWLDATVRESLAKLEAVKDRLARVDVALAEGAGAPAAGDGRERNTHDP